MLDTLPVRHGHFALESGLHTDRWFILDGMFIEPDALAPRIDRLTDLLRPYAPSAVCGPLLGGAFLAQALAMRMGVRFYFTEFASSGLSNEVFAAKYRLPAELRKRAAEERIAVVDDVISAGSSVRATVAALQAAGAAVVAVGTLDLLGTEAIAHFESQSLPLVAVARHAFNLWAPAECPLCRKGLPIESPAT
ncbi:MAG: phosphoribosyltransferase family protein [Burkholderiaceae bacterium]